MGWVGSRWLSPKASAGVAGGERARMWWGVEGRCVCVGRWQECLSACVCVRLCRFSAWKVGWRSTSAEELLLVTVRRERKRTEKGGQDRIN